MKRVLAVAAVLGLIVSAVLLATFTHVFENHERVGHFDVYRNPKAADSSVHSTLYYKRHRLTETLNGYYVDPNNPDRILFSSDSYDSPCGTFLYEGKSKQLTRLRPWPYAGGKWSPDSRFILLDRATVHELITGNEIDLTQLISKEDGDPVELKLLQWSPDGQHLAGEIGISPDRRGWDRDLVQITVFPLSFRYIATIRKSSLVWTDQQFRWTNGELQVAVSSTPERNIILKAATAIGWKPKPPTTRLVPSAHEHECSAMETSSN
jgi:hypothetical protein